MTFLLNDDAGDDPSIRGARKWRERYALNAAFIVNDPKRSLRVGNSMGTPLFLIVDPRTMRVVHRSSGYNGRHPKALLQLARKNRRLR